MYLLSKPFLEPMGSRLSYRKIDLKEIIPMVSPYLNLTNCWSIWGSSDNGEESWKCLLTPYIFLLPFPSAQLANKILLVFWGRSRKGLSLSCPFFGSSCLVGHPVCIRCSWDTVGVVPKETEERKVFLILPNHCSLSSMCGDALLCFLMNYCSVIIVIPCLWKRGTVLKGIQLYISDVWSGRLFSEFCVSFPIAWIWFCFTL